MKALFYKHEEEAKLKTERKENSKRKQEVWKQQVEKFKLRKVNPPVVAAHEEDAEKKQEEEEDQNNPSVLEEVDAQFEIDNQNIENYKQDEGDFGDFEDIYLSQRDRKIIKKTKMCILITWRTF